MLCPMSESKTETPLITKKQDNGFLNIIFNVVIPVFILNKFSDDFGSLRALFLALAFPLAYGIYDLIQKKKWNPLSILGFLNVSVTGGLAVAGLDGIWFSIKEAFFPFIIGVFVWWSARGKKPFIKTVLMNPQLMDLEKIDSSLKEKSAEQDFEVHLQKSTKLLSLSFFLSAILNFGLAEYIFKPIDTTLLAEQRARVLNEQIAQMTTWSTVVIMVPSMIFLVFILWYLIRGIKKLTGLDMESIVRS